MLHALSTCWVRFARALVNMLEFISSSSSKQREITKNCRSNATAFHISGFFFFAENCGAFMAQRIGIIERCNLGSRRCWLLLCAPTKNFISNETENLIGDTTKKTVS